MISGMNASQNPLSEPATLAKPKRGVVAVIVSGAELLMIQRSLTVRAPGKYCFPGGTIEAGEKETDALRRELLEELHLPVDPVEELWQCVTSWGTELTWWLAEAPCHDPIQANPLEVAWWGWMPIEQILAHPELLPSNRDFFRAYFSGGFSLPIRG